MEPNPVVISYRKSPYDRFKGDLDGNEDSDNDEEDQAILNEAAKLSWLTDEEFLQKCRMSPKSFNRVLKEIKPCAVFKKLEGKTGRPQTPVANQFMVFLKYVRTEGNGASGCQTTNLGWSWSSSRRGVM